jgi:hypothetical protein
MEAMRRGGLDLPPMGGEGKIVEADETYFGNVPEAKRTTHNSRGKLHSKNNPGISNKRAIITLVERGGEARSFHVHGAYLENVVKIVKENIAKETRLMTDESRLYMKVGKEFAAHETVKSSVKISD